MGMKHRTSLPRVLTVAVCLLLILSPFTTAAEVWRGYEETEWDTAVPAPPSYEAALSVAAPAGMPGSWKEPQDLAVSATGLVYVLDSGNNRITVLDSRLAYLREITALKTADGAESSLNKPQGIFVDAEENLYIADTGNARAVKIDGEGRLLAEFLRPESENYTSESFVPKKVLVDPSGMVYVLSESVFQGALLYDQAGDFQGFFGSADVQLTAQLLLDRVWKQLFSLEQRQKLAKYVPVEFSSFDVDGEGIVYTCSFYTTNNVAQLRRLNYLGNNLFEDNVNFGEETIVSYRTNTQSTSFVDVCVDDSGFLYALDITRGRVYVFDMDGERLMTFGTLSEQTGGFRKAAALDTLGDQVLVLDALKNNLTVFRPSAYGEAIREAVGLYRSGEYTAAMEPWQNVLRMNANNELAYRGMGLALMQQKDYQSAARCFRLGYDRENESRAFQMIRSDALRANIVWIIPLVLTLLAGLLFISARPGRRLVQARAARRENRPAPEGIRLAVRCGRNVLCRPVETLNEMKYARYTNWGVVLVLTAAWFLVQVAARQLTGFRFNLFNPSELNILAELLKTVVVFFLFCIVNWAVCTLMDGEGRFLEICTVCAYALVPYLLFRAVGIGLSNLLSLEEEIFLNWFIWIGLLWSAMLLFQGIRIVHQYSTGKAILAILLSLLGIAIFLFFLLLIFALFQQIFTFFRSVIGELMFRR